MVVNGRHWSSIVVNAQEINAILSRIKKRDIN